MGVGRDLEVGRGAQDAEGTRRYGVRGHASPENLEF